jgi:hypothetical protein
MPRAKTAIIRVKENLGGRIGGDRKVTCGLRTEGRSVVDDTQVESGVNFFPTEVESGVNFVPSPISKFVAISRMTTTTNDRSEAESRTPSEPPIQISTSRHFLNLRWASDFGSLILVAHPPTRPWVHPCTTTSS